jgi:hypothetical protein
MLRWVASLVFLSIIPFVLLDCYSQVQAQAANQESADNLQPYTWDFGQVKTNTVIKRSFNFKNESGRTLNITGINTSCGCTGSQVKNKTLLPGQSTEVIVSFNSRGYSPGPLKQYVYINTDDPNQPVLKFTVEIEIVK